MKDVDVVIHLAGLTGGGTYHKEHPAEIFYGNMMMGVNLMEAARGAGVKKIVIAGSATEYPADAPMPLKEEDLWNGFPEARHAPYSIAKRALLVQGQAYRAQYGFNVVHLLLTSMFGPFAKPDGGPVPGFIERIVEAKKTGENEVVVWGTGKATRDFLYVGDAAEAIIMAAEKYDGAEPVNVGSGEETSIKILAETIAELCGFKGALHFDPTKSSDETRRVLDVSRAEKAFGFRARTSLRDGLRKTLEWYNSEHA